MASVTVTYLFCRLLQSDVCQRTKDLINASSFEACNWLRLRWQTISKVFTACNQLAKCLETNELMFDLTALKSDI